MNGGEFRPPHSCLPLFLHVCNLLLPVVLLTPQEMVMVTVMVMLSYMDCDDVLRLLNCNIMRINLHII